MLITVFWQYHHSEGHPCIIINFGTKAANIIFFCCLIFISNYERCQHTHELYTCLKSLFCNYKYISHILPRLWEGQPRNHGLIAGWSEGFFSSQSRSKPVLGQTYSVGTATVLTLVRTNHILSARDPWCTSAMLPLLSMINGLTLSSWKPEKSVTSSRRTPDGSSPFHLSYMKLSCHYLQSHSHLNFLCERGFYIK